MTALNDCLIRIVDDEADVRDSLSYLFAQEGWQVRAYESAEAFLADDAASQPGCVILDIEMQSLSGLDLQDIMIQRGLHVPIVFFSGHGTLETAVRSMKKGAANFLQKTVSRSELLSAVAEAVQTTQQSSFFASEGALVAAYDSLTELERRIAELVAQGLVNGEIARKLSISPKTVRNQKVLIKQKLHAETPAALTLIVKKVHGLKNGL